MDTRVHVSLEVSDLARAIDFYSRLFGVAPTKVRDDYANFRMESPALHLALVHRPNRKPEPAPGQSNRHYGIELFADDRLAQWHYAANKVGLELRTEEEVTCCYAVANKFWARDPDGHEWEFWVRHGEADAMHGDNPKEETAKPTTNAQACCAPGKC